MKTLHIILICLCLLNPSTSLTLGATEKPNLLVILIDDMGWRDVGFAGNKLIDTPHIDRLANAGTVFTQAYSSAPNCAPTRACLITGQYPPRHQVFTVVDDRHKPGSAHHRLIAVTSQSELATESVTIAEVLKEGGYATAMIGMWNLGRGRRGPCTPTGQGFDVSKQAKELGFEKDAYHDGSGRYLADAFAEEAVQFIRHNKSKPWFLYFAPHSVHAPFDPPPALLAKYQKKALSNRDFDAAHAASVEALDVAIGRILTSLKQLNLEKNTLVVFTSDNGGTRQYVAPLRGGKGTVYEGGIRVPMVVRGPGVKAGVSSDTPVLSMDIYPTLAGIAQVKLPKIHVVDGEDLSPVLSGEGDLKRDSVYWHFPSYVGRNGPASVIRRGDFKLIEHFESKSIELYNLVKDPSEARDLSKDQKKVADDLLARLHAWQKQTKAPRPTTANPAFDPNAERPRGRNQRGKGKGQGERQKQGQDRKKKANNNTN
ncbi:sulfatase [Verrucomicrobiaceae bacterium N1E253]|uniref:Sulfatase n=1 Tax=Oceaniferula marina TaxID=2748318 RepID=A0A851GP94_9BACT|nr:sulfatase [Oceaniferula marina]NWK56945.1 sulfatase [Oceaniferula marina]